MEIYDLRAEAGQGAGHMGLGLGDQMVPREQCPQNMPYLQKESCEPTPSRMGVPLPMHDTSTPDCGGPVMTVPVSNDAPGQNAMPVELAQCQKCLGETAEGHPMAIVETRKVPLAGQLVGDLADQLAGLEAAVVKWRSDHTPNMCEKGSHSDHASLRDSMFGVCRPKAFQSSVLENPKQSHFKKGSCAKRSPDKKFSARSFDTKDVVIVTAVPVLKKAEGQKKIAPITSTHRFAARHDMQHWKHAGEKRWCGGDKWDISRHLMSDESGRKKHMSSVKNKRSICYACQKAGRPYWRFHRSCNYLPFLQMDPPPMITPWGWANL